MPASRRNRLAAERGSVAQTLALGVLVLVIAAGAGLLGAMATADRPDTERSDTTGSIDTANAVGVLEMECFEDGAGVQEQAVRTQTDGVHVAITGDKGVRVFFRDLAQQGYGPVKLGGGGVDELVLPLPPGTWNAICSPADPAEPFASEGVAFVVTDPKEVFVSSEPKCGNEAVDFDVYPLPAGFAGQEAILREVLDGRILATDVVQRAGYPDSVAGIDPPTPVVFRVVRDGTVVASVNAAETNGGWSSSVIGCLGGRPD